MRPVNRVLGVLNVTSGPDSGGEYLAFCPAHDDKNTPNLRVREAEGGRVSSCAASPAANRGRCSKPSKEGG